MTSKVYTDFVTPVDAASLNDFNTATYTTVPANTAAILTETNARIAADALKAPITSAALVTPNIGAATGTSLGLTSTLSATQVTATVATGTAPLVVTSTTPVANLSIGGNATTATTATTANGLNNTAALKLPSITVTMATGAFTFSAASRYLDFGKAALTDGTNDTLLATPTNLVLPSGGTLGTPTTTKARIVLVEMNIAGVAELAVVNIAGGNDLSEAGIISTTAISTTSTANNVFYSTTARTGVAYRVVGIVDSVNTAGAWAAPTLVRGAGGNGGVSAAGGKLVKVTIITASNTVWAKQAGTTRIIALCISGSGGGGAGGGGAGGGITTGGAGGTGGGAAMASIINIEVPPATISAVIGAAGTGGISGFNVNGGAGGGGGATSFGVDGAFGGNGGNGGAGGSSGGSYSVGGNGIPSVYVAGGAGGATSAAVGVAAAANSYACGGGGGGAGLNAVDGNGGNGGAGNVGKILVWEYA